MASAGDMKITIKLGLVVQTSEENQKKKKRNGDTKGSKS
jgi:hypothetical protein